MVKFVAPKIDDTNPRCFAMTEQEKRFFNFNEVDAEFFPFNANNGIYLMRTKVKGTKGREDTFRVRIVIVDIYRCSDFERRNDENDKGEIKKTILISTETDFSPSILLDFVPEKFVDSMMKDYLAQESELIETSKKNISITTIGVLIEYLKKYKDVQSSISELRYFERRVSSDRLTIEGVKVVPIQYFYDFFRSRWDDPEVTFESFMDAIKEKKLKKSAYLRAKYLDE